MTDPRSPSADPADAGAFDHFSRRAWAERRPGPDDLPVDRPVVVPGAASPPPDEIRDIYLPLCHLLIGWMAARDRVGDGLSDGTMPPYVIGVCGSVAVGKSTTSGVLQALLRRGSGHLDVQVLSTDAFLFPNQVLQDRGVLARKGFPETYDQPSLIGALAALRAGRRHVQLPVYSHARYDIDPDQTQILDRPDVLIVEGLTVLQPGPDGLGAPAQGAVDLLDTSVYVDAAEEDIARWFRDRLLGLRGSGEPDSNPFLRWLTSLSDEEAAMVAEHTWTEVNLVNLRRHVAPSRSRAQIVLVKGGDHRTQEVLIRRAP